jgi:ectoine hydrolase
MVMPFEKSEYLERVGKTKMRMADAHVDVLLVTDPANMNYLSGYDSWSFYVHQAVIVALEEDEPIWIGRAQDVNGAKLTTFLRHDNIIGYPDDYVQSAVKHPMEFVAAVLEERGLADKAIGVEADCYYFTGTCYDTLRRALPDATFKDANLLVNWVRAVKSEQEIGYMRQAARIVERVMAAAIDAIAPGVRQCDAAAAIKRAQTLGTPEFGGDYPAIVPLMPTGVATAAPHLTWSDAPFESGQGTSVEVAGVRYRYHCPLTRTIFLGAPPTKMTDAAEVVVEGIAAALDAVKPAATCEEVEAAWRRVISKSGIKKDSRIGYSTGIGYPPDWGERTISLRAGDRTVLQPNMTIHLMPGIWMEDWGISISETFRVTETGAETLAKVPRKLFVKA